MDGDVLCKEFYRLAKPQGYRRKGRLFWKTGPELTLLFHFQRSMWGRGIYVNLGVTPTAMVIKPVPPPAGLWSSSGRAESLECPFRETFNSLATDNEDEMTAEDVTEALLWLLSYMETEYGDTEAFRQRLLARPYEEGLPILDWAHRILKDPFFYFGRPNSYYRKPT